MVAKRVQQTGTEGLEGPDLYIYEGHHDLVI